MASQPEGPCEGTSNGLPQLVAKPEGTGEACTNDLLGVRPQQGVANEASICELLINLKMTAQKQHSMISRPPHLKTVP